MDLIGWKSIARFLSVSERTARRWEVSGLPVKRIPVGKRPTVYSSKRDIEKWLNNENH